MRRRGLVAVVMLAGLVGSVGAGAALAQTQATCTREYVGDLVLTGDQSLVIAEGVLCVRGNIVLRDNARLEVSGATIRMNDLKEGLWGSWASISIHDTARLVLRDTRVQTPGARDGGLWIYAYDSSYCEFAGVSSSDGAGIFIDAYASSRLEVRSSLLREVRVKDRAEVRLIKSAVDMMLDLAFTGTSKVELSDLRRATYADWRLDGQMGTSLRLSLEETYVHGWSIEIFDRAQVAVKNSSINRVILAFPLFPTRIHGMRPGHHSVWELQDAAEASGSGNVTLRDTWVGGWTLFLHGGHHEMVVHDSHLGGVHIMDSNMRLYLEDTAIRGLIAGGGHLRLTCDALTILQGMELRATRLDITGALSFDGEDPTIVWDNASIVREYEVHVRDEGGRAARSVEIWLEDPSRGTVAYTTDREGILRFTIRFDSDNFGKTWNLLAPRGGTTIKVPITLLTSTPVQISAW